MPSVRRNTCRPQHVGRQVAAAQGEAASPRGADLCQRSQAVAARGGGARGQAVKRPQRIVAAGRGGDEPASRLPLHAETG